VLASAIHVYDSDYWAHSLFGAGVRLDRFASRPGYFAESYSETQAIAASWRGNAEVLASAFGVDAALIGAYLQYVDSPDGAPSKALPDDRFDLDDFWVFTDFWSRAGITYPDDMSAYERVLRLPANFARRLPTMADDEL
jgi:hypothetical protein